jgi:NADP-dependent 3-hydroxy acid dehydrogenase YdfG
MSQELNGRVAVITGASSGIGEATAKLLASRGARVALLARRKDRLDALSASITQAGGKAASWQLDVTDRKATERVAAEILEKFGSVAIVVNNAGVMLPNPIEQRRVEQWQQQIDLNIIGLLNVIAAFTPALLEAGAGPGPADLVNISSIAAKNIFPNFAVYGGTKAFVTHLSVNLRTELGPKGVRVSSIEPGIVGTELQSHVDFQGAIDWLEGAKAQMDWLAPEDIAEAIAFTVGLPKRVNLQQVTIMPTGQAS